VRKTRLNVQYMKHNREAKRACGEGGVCVDNFVYISARFFGR